ncbi:hypothetical protein C8J57DRAFT_1704671 [Mycena rebaudengoi]|nr:hypothetical protein C8J57DRAFT_1704671 [Mycena rebaudengoi]
MPLPEYVSERFDLFDRATPEEWEWYGPLNTLLGHLFPSEHYEVALQCSFSPPWQPRASVHHGTDRHAFVVHRIHKRAKYPVCVVEVRPARWRTCRCVTRSVRWSMTGGINIVPTLVGISALGSRFAVDAYDTASRELTPPPAISMPKDPRIALDDADTDLTCWAHDFLDAGAGRTYNASTFFAITIYTRAGDSQSRACPLWTITHFRTIHGVLEAMTKFFVACSCPPMPARMIMVLPSSPGCIDVCRGRDYQERTDTSFDANHVRTADEAVRKCSGSMSLESDVPPKRLKLGPLKGWGVEKDGKYCNTLPLLDIGAWMEEYKDLFRWTLIEALHLRSNPSNILKYGLWIEVVKHGRMLNRISPSSLAIDFAAPLTWEDIEKYGGGADISTAQKVEDFKF